MLAVSSIDMLKEEKAYAWNIIFTLNDQDMKFATDIIYAVKRGYWTANTFITHDLASLLQGADCSYCNKNKIACLSLSTQHVEVMEAILKSTIFQDAICEQLDELNKEDFPLTLKINNDQKVWDDIVYENTTYKILKRQ